MTTELNIEVIENLKNMPDDEFLTTLLMIVTTKENAQKISKTLLDTYFSVSNVLVAPTIELMNIKDVGEDTAIFLNLVAAAVRKLEWEKGHNWLKKNGKDLYVYC